MFFHGHLRYDGFLFDGREIEMVKFFDMDKRCHKHIKGKKNLAHNKFDSLNRTSNQPINSSIFIEKVQTTR